MAREQKAAAIKKLQTELKEEKQAEITLRRDTIQARKKAQEERRRLEEEKAKVRSIDATIYSPT